ncbi:MAG: hypothetical protein JO352_23065 [Chloroflexi bacterium]|nr:hypothetical protein [Chloroflexota bacterium]MBV9602460.1 hypothetical protein [Chloroflexota bacterium]
MTELAAIFTDTGTHAVDTWAPPTGWRRLTETSATLRAGLNSGFSAALLGAVRSWATAPVLPHANLWEASVLLSLIGEDPIDAPVAHSPR